jgi:hypothetical protein
VNGKVTIVGIVSFGRTTCTPLVANGYERVTFQKDWILSNSDAANWQCTTGKTAQFGILSFRKINLTYHYYNLPRVGY